MNKYFVTSALSLMLVISSAAMSGPGGPGMRSGLGLLGHMADEIGLTVEQEEAINELVNTSKLDSAVDRERMSQLREELSKLSQADDAFDASTASVLADELSEIVARSTVSGAQLRWQIRQVLSEEQRELLAEIRAGRADHRFRFEPEAISM